MFRLFTLFLALALIAVGCANNSPRIRLSVSSSSITQASTLLLTANPEGHTPSRVAFFDADNPLGDDAEAPYTLEIALTSAQNGQHTYRSVALNALGDHLAEDSQRVDVAIATASAPKQTTVVLQPTQTLNQSPNPQSTVLYNCRLMLCAGDDAANQAVRSLLVFDLSSANLPPNASLTAATLRIYKYNDDSTSNTLGTPILEEVNPDAEAWFSAPALQNIPAAPLGGASEYKEVDLLSALRNHTATVGLRLRLSQDTNNDGVSQTAQYLVRNDFFSPLPEESPKLLLTYNY